MWEGIRHSVVCVCRDCSKAVALKVDGRSQRATLQWKLSFPGFRLLALILFFRRHVNEFSKSVWVSVLKYNSANSWHFVMDICVTLRQGIWALTACMPLRAHARALTQLHSRGTLIELIDLKRRRSFSRRFLHSTRYSSHWVYRFRSKRFLCGKC